ncbi:hypothetical protein H4R34_003193 [Dimargaris verticillata]|uniref:Uncharacterized protein n=1 Tax=Dimargaris verticillata TaxID=2761393 RepID=A0A9W8E8H0_9FUNG|nr:hypothetical protein H4R34_003193 [Dimargaris verticillata]
MGGGKKKGGNRSNKKNASRKKSSPGLTGNNATPPATTTPPAPTAAVAGIAPVAVSESELLAAPPTDKAVAADPTPVADRNATVPVPTQELVEENPATAYTAEPATKPTTTALEPESAGAVGGAPVVDLAPANHDTTTIQSNRVDAPLPEHVVKPFPTTVVAANVPPVVATRDDATEPQPRDEAVPATKSVTDAGTGAAQTRHATEALGPNGADEGASVATLQSQPGVITANSHPASLAASSRVTSQMPNVPPPMEKGAAGVPLPHKVNDVTPLTTRQQIAAERQAVQAEQDNVAPTLNGGNGAGPRKTPTGLGLGNQQPQDAAANGTEQVPGDFADDSQPGIAASGLQATKRMSTPAQQEPSRAGDATGPLGTQSGPTQQPPTSAAPGTEEGPGAVPPTSGGDATAAPATEATTGTKTEVPHKPSIFKRALRKVSRMFH